MLSKTFDWKVFYRTLYVQGMFEGKATSIDTAIEAAQEGLLEVFTKYKKNMKKDDRQLFKTYFEQA